mmetsp:Transcript_18053/g.41765  ORF Transcript_18053/g.41765 Transcript_18053/m.41765 type:complete len:93 (+) Transcript_18053:751-1029(+)
MWQPLWDHNNALKIVYHVHVVLPFWDVIKIPRSGKHDEQTQPVYNMFHSILILVFVCSGVRNFEIVRLPMDLWEDRFEKALSHHGIVWGERR